MYQQLLSWGLAVAVGTLGACNILCIPDLNLTPSAILALGTAPSGGSASDGTTATQTGFEVETSPATANQRDINGFPGARWKGGGNPTTQITLTATAAVPGVPGETARYTYSDGTDTYGASEPYVLSSIESVSTVTSGNGYRFPQVVATPDGKIHEVEEDRTSSPGTLRYRSRSATTETWGSATNPWGSNVPSQTFGTNNYTAAPTIWYVRSNASAGYTLFVGSFFATSTSVQRLRISQSSDGGATWTSQLSDLRLTFSGTVYYQNLKIVWNPLGEQLTLSVVKNDTGTYSSLTYVSNDKTGSHWLPLPAATIASVTQQDLTTFCGVDYLAVITSSTNVALYRRDSTSIAWALVNSDTGGNFSSTYPIILTPNDSGWLYLLGRASADEGEMIMQVATDRKTFGAPDGVFPYDDGLATTILDDDADGGVTTLVDGAILYSGAWVGEALYTIGTLKTSATTVDNSSVVLIWGGISNLTTEQAASGTDAPYYPTSIPETKSSAYSAFTTSGATTQTIEKDSEGSLVYALSNDNSTGIDIYTPVGNPSVAGAIWGLGTDTAGGAAGASYITMVLLCHDDASGDNYNVQVRISKTDPTLRVFVYDVGGAATVADVTGFSKTTPFYVFAALDGQAGNVSVYGRNRGDTAWTTIADGVSLTSTGTGGATTVIRWGKLAASTANIDTLLFIPMGSASTGFVADIADGLDTSDLTGIRATQSGAPQRLPQAVSVWWEGSPIYSGDVHTLQAIAQRPLALVSPLCATPSPTRAWIGPAGSAAATYRVVYDYGSGYEARSAHGLAFVGWANAAPMASVAYQRWGGSSWSSDFSVAGYANPFGADGAVAFKRDSANSLTFTPNGANGQPVYVREVDYKGRWMSFDDGTNSIIGKVLQVINPGQFSTSTGAMQAAIVLDRANYIVQSGALSALCGGATGTTTGNVRLYFDDGIGIGSVGTDAVRYQAVIFTLAPGVTIPQAGMLAMGPAWVLPLPERDGSSMRQISNDDIRQIPGTGIVQGRVNRRRPQRVYELPFDQVLVQPGAYVSGGQMSTVSISGNTARATVDSNLDTMFDVHARVGQRAPIGLILSPTFGGDPAMTPAVFGNNQIVWGTMARELDRTASLGRLRDSGYHATAGGSLVVAELI